MKQEEIKYADVMSLGFERTDSEDPVFFKQYGYQYFILEKILRKSFFEDKKGKANKEVIYVDWCCINRTCEVIRVEDNEGSILGRMPIKNLKHLKAIIKLLGDKSWVK